MKKAIQPQPNFEALKVAFYTAYVNSEKVNLSVSMENLCGSLLPSWHKRKDEFKKDFNAWLNGLDIRQTHDLIDILVKDKKPVPHWMATRQFVIDYNDREALDLIRIDNIDND